MRIGLVGAMPEEIEKLLAEMTCTKQTEIGKRIFYEGTLYGKEVVLVFSRWGKVAAATTVTQLIVQFQVDKIVFTGIAGALSSTLKIGDVVIAQRLFQHDMDARPLMKQYEIPLVGKTYFETNTADIELANQAVNQILQSEHSFKQKLADFGIHTPKVYIGDIASGDKFVGNHAEKETILKGLPSVLCVEMEGAAVAQVCYDFNIPFLVIRTISDAADDKAIDNFPVFLENIASEYAHYILKELFSY